MANAGKKKSAPRGNKTRSDRAGKRNKARHMWANDMFEDNSPASRNQPNENIRLNRPMKHKAAEIESVPVEEGSTTKFICKVCGNTFSERGTLNEHLAELHHPRRTVTAADIVNGVFEGRMNFPKTKAEIVRYVEENKDAEAVTPEVIDTVKNMPDKLYFTEADFVYGIEQTIR